jgi:hypothetical protein
MTVKEMVNVLKMCPSSTATSMVQEFSEIISMEHRTHQANIVRNLQHILIAYGQNNRGTDLRNEAAVQFAQQVSELEAPIPYV